MVKDFFIYKKVLITGATGVVGVNLCQELSTVLGIEIHINYLNDLDENIRPYLEHCVHHRFDICDIEAINQLEEYDVVFYLSGYGQPKKFTKDPEKTFSLNTSSLNALVKKVRLGGDFLFMSSSEVYVNSPTTKETESIVISPENVRNCYILGKLCGEKIVEWSASERNINAKSVRICLAYGPFFKKNDTRVLNELISKAVEYGEIDLIDDGSAIRQYIYIDDAIEMILNIVANGRYKLYNVGGKEQNSIFNIGATIGIYTSSKFKWGKAENKLINSPDFAGVDISRYEEEFGKVYFTNMHDGIRKCVDWYRSLK